MMIDKETLDSMLWLWARYREKEFKEVSWPAMSMSGKMIEAAKVGIFSHGTKHYSSDYSIPEHIDSVQKALMQLPLSQQQVVRVEYERDGQQKHKARCLRISLTHYRAKLCRARQKLMKLL